MSSCFDCGDARAEVCSWCVREKAASAADGARESAAFAERAAVVAWLRERATAARARSNTQEGAGFWDGARESRGAAKTMKAAADAIERGEHTQPPPVAGEEG